MKNQYAYCLTHDSPLIADLPIPTDECVVVYSPVPNEFDLDGWEWTMSLPLPDEDEMAQMDESAEALLFDLQGDLS